MKSKNKIRVCVVDDSALMRSQISAIINSSNDCEVVATARNGEEAIRIVEAIRPDVITMDVAMSPMDGVTCVGYIMSEWPTPIVMLSAFTDKSSLQTIKALEMGAVDFVSKPGGQRSSNIDLIAKELLKKISLAAQVDASELKPQLKNESRSNYRIKNKSFDKVLVIGASTGGPRAISFLISNLNPELKLAILIVQHMPENFTSSFAKRLDLESKIKVKLAENGDQLEGGIAYLAPGGFHLRLDESKKNLKTLSVQRGEKVNYVCPSIDVTLNSVAEIYRKNTIAVLLTGMGSDGVNGLIKLRSIGGFTIAEDESTSVVYGMPRSAVEANAVDKALPLYSIPKEIERLVKR